MQPWILAVLVLFFVQTLLPYSSRYLENMGRIREVIHTSVRGRDNLPELSVYGARADRALNNMKEALPVFLPLALLLQMQPAVPELGVLGAKLFFGFRVLYVPAYISAVPGLRSTLWGASLVGIGMMAWSLFAPLA